MADNDYNIIKPVESLQNIGNINAAKRRKERKKKQNSREQEKRQHKPVEDVLNESTKENNIDEHSIDYRA